jgi:flagellar hook protein FlgE
MTAIPHAAEALSNASGRFERASASLLRAASGVEGEDAGAAIVDMTTAKIQYKASVAVIRFSNDMWEALLDIKRGR